MKDDKEKIKESDGCHLCKDVRHDLEHYSLPYSCITLRPTSNAARDVRSLLFEI